MSHSDYSLFRLLLDVDMCGVAFHLLSPSEETDFRETGTLPEADVHCDRTEAFLTHPVTLLVVQNKRPLVANYILTLEGLQVSRPYSLAAVPALVLLLAGGVGLTVLILRKGLRRAEEGLREARAGKRKKEEKGKGGRAGPHRGLSARRLRHPPQDKDYADHGHGDGHH